MITLPAITNGTDKQVAWAEKIRAAVVVEIKRAATGFKKDGITPEAMFAKHLAMFAEAATTDAVAWIEAYKAAGAFFGDDGSVAQGLKIAKIAMTKA